MVRPYVSWLLLAGTVLLSACGQLTSKNNLADPGSSTVQNLGCIQGVAVNGLTGEPVAVASLASGKGLGVRVLVGDTVLAPGRADAQAQKEADLSGHYTLCDIPLDENYPVLVDVDGFQKIEGVVKVESTAPSKSPEAKADIAKLVPTSIVNLRLYPVGVQTSDLKFVVTNLGEPQKEAQVILLPTGANTLDVDNFLLPKSVSPKPLTMTTDENGAAVFPAAELVLGSQLHYRVIPPTTDIKETIAEGDINVGLLAKTAVQHPYLVYVDLKNPLPALDQVSSSLDAGDFNDKGDVTLFFNRDVEIVPGTEDNVVASLQEANGAELVGNIPGNSKPDQVTVTITGNKVHLVPNFKQAPDKRTEGGLKITYNGLSLRPASSPGTANVRVISQMVVQFFGGVTPPQVVSALGLPSASGAGQSAPARTELAQPIQVRVLDQFGNPYKGSFDVVFTTTGDGTVRRTDTSSGGSSVTVTADRSTGLAKIYWKLGSLSGEQILTVSGGQLKPITVSATALAVPTYLRVTRGSSQIGKATLELPEPIEVQVLDQSQLVMNASVPVRFTPLGPGGGTVRRSDGSDSGSFVDVRTTTDAKAAVYWTLGSRGAAGGTTQSLEVKIGALTTTVTATAQQTLKTLGNLSGDSFLNTAIGTDLTLQVQLLDQERNPYRQAGKLVTFQVVAGSGTLRSPGTAAPGSATTFQASTDADGKAAITFRLTGGDPGAAFQIRATTGDVDGNVTWTGSAAPTLASIAPIGGGTPVGLGSDVTYAVQLSDQLGAPLRTAGVEVKFNVASSNGTVRRPADAATQGTASIAILTDASGKATVTFRPTTGPSGASFLVTATVATLSPVNFIGTVQ